MINNYSFKKIDQEDLDRMLTLRNQEQVRDASFNKGLILPEVHSEWFSKKQSSSFFHHYALKHNDLFIGIGYGESFSIKDSSCLWGFYANQEIISEIKYGSIIKYLLFEKLFEIPEVKKISCQVLKDYEWIKDWHLRWGHKLDKYDKDKKCFELSLDKEEWLLIKENIYHKDLGKVFE